MIPETWLECEMKDIARIVGGGTPNASEADNFGGDVSWVTPSDLSNYRDIYISKGKRFLSSKGLKNSSAVLLPKGTVLFSTRAPIGYVAVAANELSTNQGFRSFICKEGIIPEYVYYYLRTMKSLAEQMASGTTFLEISGTTVGTLPFVLPPTNEQRRIVKKLDGLMDRLSAARVKLERVPPLLSHFRRTVLAAACSGALSRDWREENGEEVEWSDYQMKDLVKVSSGEAFKKSEYSSEGLRLLQIANVSFSQIIWEQQNFLPTSYLQSHPHLILKEGDIVMALNRPLIDWKFKVARVQKSDLPAILYQRVGRFHAIKNAPEFDWDFLFLFLQSWEFIQELNSKLRGSDQPYVNPPEMLTTQIKLPALAEQHEIVRRVNELFALADSVDARFNTAKAFLDRMPAAVLAKAFRGELVPQNESDESATILFQRLSQSSTPTRDRKSTRAKTKGIEAKPKQPTIQKSLDFKTSEDALDADEAKRDFVPFATSTPFRLLSLKVDEKSGQGFKGLPQFAWTFSELQEELNEEHKRIEPICLVGVNGSGKSKFMELLASIFCDLELPMLPYGKGAKNEQAISIPWEIEYLLPERGESSPVCVHITNTGRGEPRFKKRNGVGDHWQPVTEKNEMLDLLPTRIIAYSSGQNETLSLPFFRARMSYGKENAESALKTDEEVAAPRAMFMDYDSNASVLLANFLFRNAEELSEFRETARIENIDSFKIRLNFASHRSSGNIIRTSELQRYVADLTYCATGEDKQSTHDSSLLDRHSPWKGELIFQVDDKLRGRVKERFKTPKQFFEALYKLQMLNSLRIERDERRRMARLARETQTFVRLPSISSEAQVLAISDIKMRVHGVREPVLYSELSDGEHQFIHVLGTLMIFDDPGALFLFDEPETHFNPQWRRELVQTLNKICQKRKQEYVFSTHAPFMVSDCHARNVYKFQRQLNGEIKFYKVRDGYQDKPGFETYGASFQLILKDLFNLPSLISKMSLEEIQELKGKDPQEVEKELEEFGESYEKLALYEIVADYEEKLQSEGVKNR